MVLVGCSENNGIAPSNEKQMLSFRFENIQYDGILFDISAIIDHENKTVLVTMPRSTDISALEPVLEVSPGASYDPKGPKDFTNPINYTVTAADGTSKTYLVLVSAELSQKELLLLFSEVNPGNTLEWDANMNINDFKGVTIDENGMVIQLSLGNKGLRLLPPEIGQLSELKVLSLINNRIEVLPPEIGQLSKLGELILKENDLTVLPPEIVQLSKLYVLIVSHNKLAVLPPEIGQLTELELLYLNTNLIEVLPPELGQLSKLVVLILDENKIEVLPPELGQLSELHELYLSHNKLVSIPLTFANLENLSLLRLADNEDLIYLHNIICDKDKDKGGNIDIDVVPDDVQCVGDEFGG